jgi:hypothetical protein
LHAVVTEYLHRADDLARIIHYGRHAHVDRHPVAVLVVKKDLGRPLLAVIQGIRKRTALNAEPAAGRIHVHEDTVAAEVIEHFIPVESCDLFRSFVPEGDSPLAICEIDTFTQGIQEAVKESVLFIKHPLSPIRIDTSDGR